MYLNSSYVLFQEYQSVFLSFLALLFFLTQFSELNNYLSMQSVL